MSTFGFSDVVMIFTVVGVSLGFVAAWIVSSERRRNILKAEIKKLKIQVESCEREKFILLEKINILENTQVAPDQSWMDNSVEFEHQLQETRQRCNFLQSENDRLKKELDDAKGSLEEVYKALS